jgi:hypothetical protein
LKEVKAMFILRELFLLLLFLGVLYAISFANRDSNNAHQMVNYLHREFSKIDYYYPNKYSSEQKEKSYSFQDMNSIDEYWNWLEKVFIDKYLQAVWTDNTKNTAYLQQQTRTNKVIGWPTLRQLRVKNGKYSVVSHIHNIDDECDDSSF